MRLPLLWAIIPRLLLIGFIFAQPFIIRDVIEFVAAPRGTSMDTGYGLIGAFAFVYIGIAV